MKDFLYSGSWFDKKYAKPGWQRHATMKAALNIFLQRDGKQIVETGCCRLPDDWGAGLSTVMLGDFCKKYDKDLITVDLSPKNMEICKRLTSEYNSNTQYFVDDSVHFLKEFHGVIDLLYLDSYDYPLGELLDVYGARTDEAKALALLGSMSEDEIVNRHGHIFADCQQHCLNELHAALPHMHPKSVILIDDCDLPGGGKGRTAKQWLEENDYMCILDEYQTLWIAK